MKYDLMANTHGGYWFAAARECDWKLLLGMVSLWRQANPHVPLQAIRSR